MLQGAMLSVRTTAACSTSLSPYALVFGKQPRMAADVSLLPPSKLKTTDAELFHQMAKDINIARRLGRTHTHRATEKMIKQYNKDANPPKFKIGQSVLLREHQGMKGLSKKLMPKWSGPWIIDDIKGVKCKLNCPADNY